MSSPSSNDRFLGCLLGGALGDALGYPIEFYSREVILRRHGTDEPERLGFSVTPPARISDDTQMTLFVAEGIIRAHQRYLERGICFVEGVVARALLRWIYTQEGARGDSSPSEDDGWLVKEERLHARRAPGRTCLSALRAFSSTNELGSVEKPPNDSKGCGAVMRSAPFGLTSSSREAAFVLARNSGATTHGHPSGYLSAAYFASLIFDLSRGQPLALAMQHAEARLREERGAEEVVASIEAARRVALTPPTPSRLESLGGGWTGESALAIALACAISADWNAESVASALWRSVLHSGDSDSTGSLTGNLLGAARGMGALPEDWLRDLELRDVIERIAIDLHRVTESDEPRPEYPPN